MSKHAVRKPNLLFALILVVAIASMAVLADTITNDANSETVVATEPADAGIGTHILQDPSVPTVARVQTCTPTTWQEEQPVIANCTSTYDRITCSDPPTNKTCTTTTITDTYECLTGATTSITRHGEHCATS